MGTVPIFLICEDRGAVRILTMNRPEKRNALNTSLTQALVDALRAADADDSIACVVLTGAGQGFCAGADLSEFKDFTPEKQALVDARAELTMQLHLAFPKLSKPVVTAINGAAMGGGAGLAIAGDLAVMAEDATLGYPETRQLARQRAPRRTAADKEVPLQEGPRVALGFAGLVDLQRPRSFIDPEFIRIRKEVTDLIRWW